MTIKGFDDTLAANFVPPAPPTVNAGSATELGFPGITKPTTDMQSVRDGRRSTLLGYAVDLSVARSIAAGTQLTLAIQGNVISSDPLYDLAGNSQAGIARVHFQDTNLNPVGTFVTLLPNAIYRVPFTQVLVENFSQPGKFLYVVYGVDVDLVPGQSQQVSVLGNVSVAQAKNYDFAAVDAGASFNGFALINQNAGNPSIGQIKNPAGSTKTVYVKAVTFAVFSGTSKEVLLRGWDTDLATDNGAVLSRLNPFASTGGQSHVRSSNAAATPAGVNLETIPLVTQNTVFEIASKEFVRPYRLDPGRGLIVDPNNLLNVQTWVSWDVVEV